MKRLQSILLFGTLILGCSALQAWAGSWQTNQAVGNFTKVHVYTPDTVSPVGQGRALLVVLHGCTQSVDAYLTANLEPAAEAYGMVIAVPDALNKAGFSCWSYWQGTKSRSAGDYANLLSLVSAMTADTSKGIDADQVYIAGLSSGAAFANTTACLAPDVFAGVGVSAGPSIGTSSSGAIGSCEYADVATRCQQYAGSYSGSLTDQIASIAHGDADTTVDQCYNRQNAEGMADAYGVTELPGSTVIGSGSRTMQEFLWQDGRVSMVWLNGVDHAWSGGAGASGSYVNGSGYNYAMYLGQYFADNNKRVDRNQAPVVSAITAQDAGGQLNITGNAVDNDGSVDAVEILVQDNAQNSYQYTTTTQQNGDFAAVTASLPDALYVITVSATDDAGAVSNAVSVTARVGPPPPPTAPELANVVSDVAAQCVTVSGEVFDENEDLSTVLVGFATGNVSATVNGVSFSAQACEQPGGEQTITVTASDTAGLSSSVSVTVTVDAGVTATLTDHINAGRLDYTNYANCYLEYSTAAFKLNEVSNSNQMCQWQDNDASCTGPVQACSGGGSTGGDGGSGGDDGGTGGGTGGNTCAVYTTANYYHKVAGRAYSTGNYWTPDYFATGTNAPLSGSTWGNSTLHSSDGNNWYVGSCP
ncbi:PHB depolymerase family esterase [Alteromonas sp. AMM-1]|uniref:extracellular catalytic domain type 1 short-chain-length polyhydroxyalkanoate depolymerase n=1 Tax=Alteromonas sp. AMM-1 TaxID=3394233 RepID=UPI0039A53731